MKYNIAIGILWYILAIPLYGQTYSENIVRTYKVKPTATIDIQNKYGKIHVVSWKKDTVVIDIDLELSANSYSRLEKLKRSVNFDFTETNFYITAKTVYGLSSNSFFSELLEVAEYIIPSDNIKIDYKVYVPENVYLKIYQKFGDVYIDDYKGRLDIDLSNGDLKANKLTGNTNIKVVSGDAVINGLEKGNIDISYSNLYIRSAEQCYLVSRSTKMEIDEVSYFKADSRRDDIRIGKANKLYGNGYFSDLTVDYLKTDLNYTFNYGKLKIEKIDPAFSFIDINSEYTDILLYFDRKSAFEVDITHNKDAYLRIPKEMAKLQQKTIGEFEDELLTYGMIGNVKTGSVLKINAPKKCNIELEYR